MTHPGCLISCLEVRLPFPSAFKQEKGFPPWVGEKKKNNQNFPPRWKNLLVSIPCY